MAKEKHYWIAKIRCEVIKEICLDKCTEEEARENPWKYSVEERELEMTNWKVESLGVNE